MALVLVAVLGACQGGGVEIVVYPPADPGAKKIDEIRIYVGIGAAEVTRMGTAAFVPDRLRSGGLWARDLDGDALPYQSKKLSRDTEPAAFVFAARGDGDQLSVIALGFSNGEVTSAIGKYEIPVPTDYVAVHRIGLNAATLARPGATGMTQVELWGAPNAETCVQLIDRGGYSDPRYPIAYITTPADADCDGYAKSAPEECDDHYFQGSVTPSTSTLSCLDDGDPPSGQPVSVCHVGGPACVDGTPASTHVACSVGRPYCAAKDLCARCQPEDFTDPFTECAIDPLAHAASATDQRIVCQVPVSRAADTGAVTAVCPHTLAIGIPLLVPGQACSNVMFHGPAKQDSWRQRIELGEGKYSVVLANLAAGCTIRATPIDLPAKLLTEPAVGGLLALDLGPAAGAVYSLVLEPSPTLFMQCPAQPLTVTCTEKSGTAEGELAACLNGAL